MGCKEWIGNPDMVVYELIEIVQEMEIARLMI